MTTLTPLGPDETMYDDVTVRENPQLENGRTYQAYKQGPYVLPNDQPEKERLDLQHNLLLATFDGKLHCAPLVKPPARLLDSGCGTGIWSIEFAEEHPESKSHCIPPNVRFYVNDLEDDWTLTTQFDFIFSRFTTGSIRDFPRYFKQCYDALAPGGTLELFEIGNEQPLNTALKYKEKLAATGFVDIFEVQEKWSISTWAADKKHKQLGAWARENALQALSALSLAIFTRPKSQNGLGWTVKELEWLLAEVRKEFRDLSIHGYWPIYLVYAKRPE
ncbi:S-adenosyl-L-methionine-dependent methyltransferase [Immersiella caudata]|uniref:S-adenosyl-L-methionine-dependent methyltransferase n=1 Tax=Immersiella caudata TaxID=314043 RepID=A0AA40C5H0_9PEZI|nr:S-adenosyl-L-methionine-dependent methyltransferase [Immersiella caudata]